MLLLTKKNNKKILSISTKYLLKSIIDSNKVHRQSRKLIVHQKQKLKFSKSRRSNDSIAKTFMVQKHRGDVTSPSDKLFQLNQCKVYNIYKYIIKWLDSLTFRHEKSRMVAFNSENCDIDPVENGKRRRYFCLAHYLPLPNTRGASIPLYTKG